MNIKIRYI